MKIFAHEELGTADLIIDALYEGGSTGDARSREGQ